MAREKRRVDYVAATFFVTLGFIRVRFPPLPTIVFFFLGRVYLACESGFAVWPTRSDRGLSVTFPVRREERASFTAPAATAPAFFYLFKWLPVLGKK